MVTLLCNGDNIMKIKRQFRIRLFFFKVITEFCTIQAHSFSLQMDRYNHFHNSQQLAKSVD
jgi:hypothetical protein